MTKRDPVLLAQHRQHRLLLGYRLSSTPTAGLKQIGELRKPLLPTHRFDVPCQREITLR